MSRFKIFKRVIYILGLTLFFLGVCASSVFAAVDCYIEPWGAPPWETPDIFADNDYDGVQECGEPTVGEEFNYLVARIHNIGTTTAAAGTVFVKFYYAPYSIAYPHTHFKQIGVTLHNVNPITASGFQEIYTQWDLSNLLEDNEGLWPAGIGTFNHFCVRVEIECSADVDLTNNSAQNNFTEVPCSECGFNFVIANPNEEQATATLITSKLPERWKVSIKIPGVEDIREFTLAPNEAKIARLELFHPKGKYEMDSDIHVSLILDGKTAGGITFRPVRTPVRMVRSLSFHVGSAIPIGTYADDYNSGLSLITDIDFHFKSQFSIVFLFGYNIFQARVPVVNDTHWWNLSANIKKEITVSPNINIYLDVGPGFYIPHGGSVKAGFNAGLGWNYSLSNDCRLEFGSDYHRIFIKNANAEFIVTHVGVVFRY